MTDVTIIVCTYDRPALLNAELASIRRAARLVPEAVRVLVVDDASSTDAAQVVARRHGVDYLRRPVNGGIAEAIVTGFAEVDSPYYSVWGDDDIMLPNWFELHLRRIKEGFDVVSGSYWMVDSALRTKRRHTLAPVTFAALLQNEVSANDGSLVRTSALEGVKWRPERERAMMMTMWLALAAGGRRFSTIRQPTWLYRRHPGQLSRQPRERFMELRRASIAEYG